MRPRTPNARRRHGVVLTAATAVAVAVAASALSAPAAQAAPSASTHYVDCRAKSDGNGSQSSPWKSLGHVNRKSGFLPGDKILFKRGTSCSGRIHPVGSGTAAAPIVLGAYGKGAKPTINAGGSGDQTGTVQLVNQAYWTVQDLHLTNHGSAKETGTYRSGVLLRGFNGRIPGVKLQRLVIDGVVSNLTDSRNDPREFGGITVQTLSDGKPGSGFDGLQILNNRISKVGRSGIVVSNHGYPKTSDRSTRISGNTIARTRGDSIIVRGATNARIDHNTVAFGANFWPCKQCGGVSPKTANAAIWPAYSKNTVIEYNEVYGTKEVGGDGEGVDVDMSAVNTTVQYNYIHDNDGGGILFCGSNNTTARFNILENNKLGAFTFIRSIPAKNTKIYNNTVYSRVGNNAKVVRSFGDFPSRTNTVKGISFYNNLIYNMDDSGYYVWPVKPKTWSNTYIGVHGIGEPSENGKQYNDPGLRKPGSGKNGFKTLNGYKPASPKGDPVGAKIPKSVMKDFFGKKISWKKPPRGAAA